jgi:DNA-binding transcriptional ArsR family regulator
VGVEWIDAGLPQPNFFYRFQTMDGYTKDSYCIAYLIDGAFHTERNTAYLNDIIARFCLTLPIKQRLLFQPSGQQDHDRIHKLKDFQNLKSLTKKYVPKLNGSMGGDDNTFWELKLWIEHRIRDNGGEGSYVEFDLLLDHALSFYTFKDRSTAKAKCRNIWNWYEQRDFQYHMLKKTEKTKEEILMTRQERAISNAKANEERAYKKVINLITGLYADEYKKKNGAWHIGKIAKNLNMSRNTVSKHIKAFEQKNIQTITLD